VHIAEITVDTLTGEIKVDKVTVAQDVGRVINRMGLEGQVEGGIAIGLGYALSEDMRIENGMLKNACFRDYKLITAPEMPPLDLHFIESNCAEGPYGAKGISELPTIVIAPAVANALYNAAGRAHLRTADVAGEGRPRHPREAQAGGRCGQSRTRRNHGRVNTHEAALLRLA
jgi:xanthine dehydrogenase molybdenum-binding subunit